MLRVLQMTRIWFWSSCIIWYCINDKNSKTPSSSISASPLTSPFPMMVESSKISQMKHSTISTLVFDTRKISDNDNEDTLNNDYMQWLH